MFSSSRTDLEQSERLESAYDEMMNDDDGFDEMLIQNDTTMAAHQRDKTNTNKHISRTEHVDSADSGGTVNARGDNSTEGVQSDSPVAGCSKASEESPVIPVLGSKVKVGEFEHS